MPSRSRFIPVTLLILIATLGWVGFSAVQGQSSPKEEESFMSKPKSHSETSAAPSLKEKLTPLQYRVTQKSGTEPPFNNAYWDNHRVGIYVDLISGSPLFSSQDKFVSGTGWPSFIRPISTGVLVEKLDGHLWMKRTELRSAASGSHLGHVFPDGPPPTGLRFCVNTAALRFIPLEKMAAEGYGAYLPGLVGDVSATPKESSDHTATPAVPMKKEVATLAGGCFWGVEYWLEKLDGVLSVDVGYSGGHTRTPTYEEVSSGKTGHAESVRVVFDPQQISYEEILKYFFRFHDPTTRNRQHFDVGSQYRSVIFYHSEAQKKKALQVIQALTASRTFKKPIVTEVVAATVFTPAEKEHQDYLKKHPNGYNCHILRPE